MPREASSIVMVMVVVVVVAVVLLVIPNPHMAMATTKDAKDRNCESQDDHFIQRSLHEPEAKPICT